MQSTARKRDNVIEVWRPFDFLSAIIAFALRVEEEIAQLIAGYRCFIQCDFGVTFMPTRQSLRSMFSAVPFVVFAPLFDVCLAIISCGLKNYFGVCLVVDFRSLNMLLRIFPVRVFVFLLRANFTRRTKPIRFGSVMREIVCGCWQHRALRIDAFLDFRTKFRTCRDIYLRLRALGVALSAIAISSAFITSVDCEGLDRFPLFALRALFCRGYTLLRHGIPPSSQSPAVNSSAGAFVSLILSHNGAKIK